MEDVVPASHASAVGKYSGAERLLKSECPSWQTGKSSSPGAQRDDQHRIRGKAETSPGGWATLPLQRRDANTPHDGRASWSGATDDRRRRRAGTPHSPPTWVHERVWASVYRSSCSRTLDGLRVGVDGLVRLLLASNPAAPRTAGYLLLVRGPKEPRGSVATVPLASSFPRAAHARRAKRCAPPSEEAGGGARTRRLARASAAAHGESFSGLALA